MRNDVRALVKRALPESYEEVKLGWKVIAYLLKARGKPVYVGFIIPHPDSVTLGFQQGIFMPDPEGELLGASEKLKQVRYVSLRHRKDLKARRHGALVRQAAELALMPHMLRAQLRARG